MAVDPVGRPLMHPIDNYDQADDALAAAQADLAEVLASWAPIDLGPILDGDHSSPVPEIFETRDGSAAMFYRGRVNAVHGDSGIGKSWLVLAAVAQVITTGRRAVIVDYEANATEIVARLRALGCNRTQIVEHLVYVQPSHPTGELAIAQLLEQITLDTDLVVIDSLGEAFGLDGIDENSDAEVGPWLRRVARRLADAGPAVVLVDHGTKAADNPLHPSGSKRKRAAITGASYLVATTRPPTRDQAGVLTLTCAKDRHGTYARGRVAATADINPYPDGGVTVNLHPAAGTHPDSDSPGAAVEAVARAVVRLVHDQARPMTSNAICEQVDVKARRTTIRAAIEHAVARGALDAKPGARNAVHHTYNHDLDQEPPK